MTVTDNYFIAEGIPVVPVDDNNSWNPFQVAEITVKDGSGNVIAQTKATVPTSDEINCAKCHGTNAFDDILSKHDSKHSTDLSAASRKPVLCASCHPSPALGIRSGPQDYLSQVLHGSHSTRGASCYDCHPGSTTKCNRSLAHATADGNCVTCHGDMANGFPVQLPEEGSHGQMNRHAQNAITMLQVSARGMIYTGNRRDTEACTAAPVMGALMQWSLPAKLLIITSQNNTRDLHLLLKL